MCWSVWLCRNDAIFENNQSYFLQVIYRTTHWLRTWATLQQPTSQEALVAASRWLERVAKDFFLPRHMGGVLVSGSKVINVSVKPKI